RYTAGANELRSLLPKSSDFGLGICRSLADSLAECACVRGASTGYSYPSANYPQLHPGETIMRKVIGLLVLVVSVAVVGSSVVPSLEAQDKSKTKAKEKEKVGTVEIYKAKDGYRFRIKDTEGKDAAKPAKGRGTTHRGPKAPEGRQ